MSEWQHENLVAVPVVQFRLAMVTFGVTIDTAKRSRPDMYELQRGMAVTYLLMPEGASHVPPLNVETVCKALEIPVIDFYAEAKRQIASVAPKS